MAKGSLHRRLWGATALGEFTTAEQDKRDAEGVLQSFVSLRETPDTDDPLFVFAHFMVPHNPYIFDERCDPPGPAPEPDEVPEGLRPNQVQYIAQLECVNRLVLELVPALLARSPEPIILFQSDHGTRSIREFDAARHDRVPYRQAKERHGAFGAYYLPAGGDRVIPDSLTAVNLMRYVFSHYFDADLPPVSDRLFYSDGDYEYDFLPVESAPLGEPGPVGDSVTVESNPGGS